MIKIGDFSKMSKMTIKALRHYDKIGLLIPNQKDYNGYRYYSSGQLYIASKINFYKELGFSLVEISDILKLTEDSIELREILDHKQREIESLIELESKKLLKLSSLIKENREEKSMSMVELKELPEVIVASMRMTISSYDDLFKVVPAMGEKMKKHEVVCAKPDYCFNIYHADEYKEEDIDVEICEAITKMRESADGVIYKTIPGYKTAACIYHKGPYSTLGKSYSQIFKWLGDNDYKMIDSPRESFIDGIWNKESEEDWLTEIQVPIEK